MEQSEIVLSEPIVLAIVGSRDFVDEKLLFDSADNFVLYYGKPSLVVSGGARGADTLGEKWAKKHFIQVEKMLPDWNGPLGKDAGFARNTDIVNKCTHMLAFPLTGGGTKDSIKKARSKGKIVIVIDATTTKKKKGLTQSLFKLAGTDQ